MRKLDNYIRTHRLRAGLSREELAFLIGADSGTVVSRHEVSRRLPTLPTILAYEVALGVPARRLFAGLYDDVEEDVRSRAVELQQQLVAQTDGADATRATAHLARLATTSRDAPPETRE